MFGWTVCSRRTLCICSLMGMIGLIGSSLRGQQDSREDPDDTRERMVFLNTGRMLTGQVARNAGGYIVEQSNGRIQVATEDVKFIVGDLREAYRKQRDSVVEPTPATHLALANWCISYRLLDEARIELKTCLKVDPDNDEARRLLQRLADTIRADLPAKEREPLARKTTDGFAPQNVESLGGLSRETAVQFVSRIQPLLLNKCGNASCHGTASENKFRLTFTRSSGHGTRQTTEQNLGETLRYLDFENLGDSPLLSASKGAHGGKGTIFVGQAGAEQAKTLRAWARAVAQEKQAELRELEQQPQIVARHPAKRRVAQARAVVEKGAGRKEIELAVARKPQDDETPVTPSDSSIPRELKADPNDAAALAAEPDDPFDPDIFNRQFRQP